MSFSESLSLGEQTLFQLDKYEGEYNGKNTLNNNEPIVITANRSKVNHDLSSLSPHSSNDNRALDVIDESPTEKSNMLGKSIRERLKNASTSKKSNRKYMRRSRSDPINGANDSKQSKSSLMSFQLENHVLSEDVDLFFDTTIQWDDIKTDEQVTNQKSKVSQKLDDKFENDDFDKYFNDIHTPQIQRDKDQPKNNSLTALCNSDAMDVDNVNVSEVQRLMQTDIIDKTADDLNDGIEWEDSAFFNELLASQQTGQNGTAAAVETAENSTIRDDVEIDTERISMQSGRHKDIEDELESCFLEVSLELSCLNATEMKSTDIQKMGSQLDTSICSRSFTQRQQNSTLSNHNRSSIAILPKPINNLNIDNIIDWHCSPAIVKAYKKKGIHQMFEWQFECLNKPEV